MTHHQTTRQAQRGLALYLTAVVLFTSVHDVRLLGAALVLAVMLAGVDRIALVLRVFRSVLIFNSVISVSYAIMALWQADIPWSTLILLNLRVLLLTTLTFVFVARVNLFQAVSFSRTLQFAVVLSYGQIMVFRRLFEDFQLARTSRTVNRLSARDLYRHSAATVAFFLEKALHSATEITQAMRSRGFFDGDSSASDDPS